MPLPFNTGFIYLGITLLLIALGALSSYLFYRAGIKHRKEVAEAKIGSAEQEAERIIDEARKKRRVAEKGKAYRG